MKVLVQTLIEQYVFMSVGIVPHEYIFVECSAAANLLLLSHYASSVLHTLTSIFQYLQTCLSSAAELILPIHNIDCKT